MTVFLSSGSLLEDLINPMIYIHTHTQFQNNAQQCGMLFTHNAVVYLTFWKPSVFRKQPKSGFCKNSKYFLYFNSVIGKSITLIENQLHCVLNSCFSTQLFKTRVAHIS